MKFCARLSLRTEVEAVVHDLCVDLKGYGADLALLFVSHHYGPDFDALVHGVYHRINCRTLIGCTGEGIIGPTAEIESRPAAALWLAQLPGVRVFPFLLDQEDLQALVEGGAAAWHDRLGTQAPAFMRGIARAPHSRGGPPVVNDGAPSFIILADPFSIDVQACLRRMDELFPGATIVGGMASGAEAAGQNRLFLADQALRQGLVGVSLSGNLSIASVVSQGCRPVGEPFVVTRGRENLIEELGGKPALAVLQEVYDRASATDQDLMRSGLHVGRLVDEQRRNVGLGGFLVRNLMGISPDRAIAVGDYIRPGQTVQFHVRDAKSAGDEMERMLRAVQGQPAHHAHGALLFNCNGRGRRFFRQANHDISLVNSIIADCPTAGFFAAGEIGPVGGRTFIHGFTSSLILFREPGPSPVVHGGRPPA